MAKTNEQVAHLFAHRQSGDSNNLHSDGTVLKSYSTPIAFWASAANNAALAIMFISSNNMSRTTGSKHLAPLRRAASHVRTFYSPAFSYSDRTPPTPQECIEAAAEELLETFKGLHRKRANLDWALSAYVDRRAEVIEIAARFNVEIPELPEATGDLKAKAAEIDKKEEDRRKEQERRDEERREQQRRDDAAQFQEWLATGNGSFPASYQRRNWGCETEGILTDFVTIRGEKVVTSQGAEAPLDHVRKAIEFYLSRQLPALHFESCDYRTSAKVKPCNCGGGADEYKPYHTNGHKIHLGHFTLDEIDKDGNVKAGCHRFTAAEIARFIEQWREVIHARTKEAEK